MIPHSERLSRPYVRAPQWCNPGLPHAATIIISALAFLLRSLLSALISLQTQQPCQSVAFSVPQWGFTNSQMCELHRSGANRNASLPLNQHV